MTQRKLVAALEGGGTKTDWLVAAQEEQEVVVIDQGKGPPANFRLIPEELLLELLHRLPDEVARAGVYLAGCTTREDQARLHAVCEKRWPEAQISVGSDRQSGYAAAYKDEDGILVIAGTGSAVTGKHEGRWGRAGGWGHLLGDRGGGYDISVQALRDILRRHDEHQKVTPLASLILRELGLNHLDELIGWAQRADKMSIARLAPIVAQAAEEKEGGAREILEKGAEVLARHAFAVARKLDWWEPPVRLAGSLFTGTELYERLFREALEELLPDATAEISRKPGVMGALWLSSRGEIEKIRPAAGVAADKEFLAAAATEATNPHSENLDKMSPREMVRLFIEEERQVIAALEGAEDALVQAVEMAQQVCRSGGRIFYVGAGTSGRLGVLDASEIPPTFGAPPELFQGIIAGGATALHRAVEGAEDDRWEGGMVIRSRGVRAEDLVVGLSASGRTPFVLGALEAAAGIGARTILATSNTNLRLENLPRINLIVSLMTGPEIVRGSTRLKAGTATKLFLNILSTCTMVGLGHVKGNRMIDLQATNIKLRDRAIRLVAEKLSLNAAEAEERLARNSWKVRQALMR